MRIIDYAPEQARQITQFGSRDATAQAIVRSDHVAITVLRVAAGGEIGRHPAVVDQLLIVVAGHAEVCGDDGVWHPIAPGQAASWTAGEHHTTRPPAPLTAITIEMPLLSALSAILES